jgi:hypothetical protein
MLRDQDVARLAPLPLLIKLEEKHLVERFDDALGGTYFLSGTNSSKPAST